ncbi:MAG: hypothetical protein LBG76_07700 [Treponema sp.]|nr:hypothetical protein [Treponema sp.]
MEYLQTISKAKEAAKASPYVIAADDRRSLLAYAKGVTPIAAEEPYDRTKAPRLNESYIRSVLIGECTGIEEASSNRSIATIRVDHKNSPALPEFFERYTELKVYSNIWAEGRRIPFETGETYMIYADTFEAAAKEYLSPTETQNIVWTTSVNGIDALDRIAISKHLGDALSGVQDDFYTPLRSLISLSPYQRVGGIDFDIGQIIETGADNSRPNFQNWAREEKQGFQAWSTEALQYAPFIKLDKTGVAGALNAKAGFLWKKWIRLAQIAQSTLRVIAADRWEAIPFFHEDPRVYNGRAITEAEFRAGARVCVVSGQLAMQNGWKKGDVLLLAFFNNGYIYSDNDPLEGVPLQIRPIPYTMSGVELDSPVEYQIIGFYTDNRSHITRDFDAHTIIVPTASIKEYPAPQAAPITDPETGGKLIPVFQYYLSEYPEGMFSVILKKGCAEAFEAEMAARGFGGLFIYNAGYFVPGQVR